MGVLIVAGVAAFVESGGAHHQELGEPLYDLLRIAAWAAVIVGVLMAVATVLGLPAARAGQVPLVAGSSRVERSPAHPLYIGWPLTRLDQFSVIAIGVVIFACVERDWAMIGIALFAILIAALLPRMEGAFKLGGPVPLERGSARRAVAARGACS